MAAVHLAPAQPVRLAIPHSLFVRAKNPFHLVLLQCQPMLLPPPHTLCFPPSFKPPPPPSLPLSISQQVHILPALRHILNGLVAANRMLLQPPPPGKHKEEEGVIVVMTSLPFSRISLWGHKCGSARGCPTLSALTGTRLTATVLP